MKHAHLNPHIRLYLRL